MMPVSNTPLDLLLSRLRKWLSISDFDTTMNEYFLSPRSAAEIADYRAKRGALKKLRDEVTPVLHHFKFIKAKGDIRFELGDTVPDCWWRSSSSAESQG